MTTAVTQTTNIVPVQGIFGPEPTFTLVNLIGPAGSVFYPNVNPVQSGLSITNSTIDSSVIGGITPAAGSFTSIAATMGTVATTPSADTDIANKAYVDSVAQGLDIKASCLFTTTANITLSGLGTQAGGDWVSSLTASDRILVKNQTAQAENGIYAASASGWTRTADMNVWSEVPGAFTFIENGATLASTGWVTTAGTTGTIGVTAMPWTQFSGAGTYTAGNGLQLISNAFSVKGNGSSLDISSSGVQISTSWAGQTAITTLGTITTGAWNGSTVSVGYGGTGSTTFTAGLVYADGTTAFATASAAQIVAAISTTAVANATLAGKATNLAGGTAGQVLYQSAADTTAFLAVGSNGQVLTLAAGVPSWATPTVGTVTNVTGVAPISSTGGSTPAISITGSALTKTDDTNVTLTLGGSPTTALVAAASITVGWTGSLSAARGGTGQTTYTIGDILYASSTSAISKLGIGSSTTILTSSGTAPQWSAASGVSVGTATNLAGGAAASIPYQSAAGTTAFLASVAGDANKVLQSNGTSAPSWVTPTAYATVTDDTTTNAVRYPLFANVTTGNLTTEYVSSTKLNYNPSTGLFTATGFSGSGASLTSLPAGQLSGTIPTGVLGNSSLYIGTTSIALNRASSAQSLTGVNIDGSAGSATTAGTATNATNIAITDDTSTAADYYPVWVTTSTGNLPAKVSSTKLKFNPSTGVLTATGGTGGGTF